MAQDDGLNDCRVACGTDEVAGDAAGSEELGEGDVGGETRPEAATVLPLFALLSPESQARVFAPPPSGPPNSTRHGPQVPKHNLIG